MIDAAPAPNRPLVTFALFAYNREQYIREAVEGAFSKTYEPLEIMLSDDYASDCTFGAKQPTISLMNDQAQIGLANGGSVLLAAGVLASVSMIGAAMVSLVLAAITGVLGLRVVLSKIGLDIGLPRRISGLLTAIKWPVLDRLR
jgi:hypothetical protein